MTFKNIKKERLKLNLTQEQLAKKLKTSRSNVANWENGQNNPSIEILFKCSELFKCSIDYLTGHSEIKKGENMKTEEIKAKDYLSANDLMILIPNLTYENAIKYINEAREEMKKQNLFIPITRPKLALTKIIRKKFGF